MLESRLLERDSKGIGDALHDRPGNLFDNLHGSRSIGIRKTGIRPRRQQRCHAAISTEKRGGAKCGRSKLVPHCQVGTGSDQSPCLGKISDGDRIDEGFIRIRYRFRGSWRYEPRKVRPQEWTTRKPPLIHLIQINVHLKEIRDHLRGLTIPVGGEYRSDAILVRQYRVCTMIEQNLQAVGSTKEGCTKDGGALFSISHIQVRATIDESLHHRRLSVDRSHPKRTHGIDWIQGIKIRATLNQLLNPIHIAQGSEAPEVGTSDRILITTGSASNEEDKQHHELQNSHEPIHASQDNEEIQGLHQGLQKLGRDSSQLTSFGAAE